MNGDSITFDQDALGEQAYRLISDLFPICRSITGNGCRESLRLLTRLIPLDIHEVPTGTQVFDWTVPGEWNIRDAFLIDPQGHKIADFKKSNLHVVSYSVPVNRKMRLDELKPHLHSLPDRPDWIPYKTSYYKESWGFCLSHNQLQQLSDGIYEVFIDSELTDGFLTYGELVLAGHSSEEVLISTHICHPSMCNDNLSGIAIATLLAEKLQQMSLRYTYRFLFIPGTIGAITWLAHHQESVKFIEHGLVLTGLGDNGNLTYKKSRRGDAIIDRAVSYVLRYCSSDFSLIEFAPYGYDERQYCSPGFNLPVGRLSRTPHGEYPEYHTSADNLDFVKPQALGNAAAVLMHVIEVLEENITLVNRNPFCEPQLGRRGLYDNLVFDQMSLLWIINLSDGYHSLLDIAEKSGIAFTKIEQTAKILLEKKLLKVV
ncbi:DUF4910 domain-containing protein [Gemmatimonadota bacterium]